MAVAVGGSGVEVVVGVGGTGVFSSSMPMPATLAVAVFEALLRVMISPSPVVMSSPSSS